MQPEVNSPYMLWQYMHALKPQKPTDYLLHPAFARPANSYTTHQSGSISEQVVGGYGYHQQSQQTIHHHPYIYSRHTDLPTNPAFANDFGHCKNNLKQFPNNKCRTERNAKYISNPTKHLSKGHTHAGSTDLGSFTQFPRSVSPLKGSSFTIDAILKKDDKLRHQSDNGLASDETVQTSQVKHGLSYTHERSGSASPTCLASCSPGRLYGPPLMHSTPCEQERKQGRFYEFTQPYLFHQFEPVQSQHQLPHHHQAQTLGPSQLTTTSLSSLSSLSSVSSTSPISPESNQILQKGKLERKSGGKPKRIRTIFTPEQLEKLEAEFERQQYMVGTERYYLAAALNLTEAQVKVWFQNRRIKWRKQHLEQQQARLAQGDLFRDIDNEDDDESDASDSEDRMDELSSDLSNKDRVLEKTVISDETGYCSS